jgi:hypothetical protein
MLTIVRADEVIPGELFDTKCGVGDLAFCKVISTQIIEDNHPGHQDRVEIRYESDSISPTRVLMASYPVRIKN